MEISIEDCPFKTINPEFIGNAYIFKNTRPLRTANIHLTGIYDPAIVVPAHVCMGDHRSTLSVGLLAKKRN